jgi:hypothetical protein
MVGASIQSAVANIRTRITAEALRMLASIALAVITSSYFGFGPLPFLRFLTGFILYILFPEDPYVDPHDIDAEACEPIVFIALLTLCFRVVISGVTRAWPWLISLLRAELPFRSNDPAVPSTPACVASNLRHRAAGLRSTGRLLLGMIAVLLVLGFLMFQGAARDALSLHDMLTAPIQAEADRLSYEIRNLTPAPDRPEAATVVKEKRERLQNLEARLAEMSPLRSLPTYLLFVISAKVLAVVFLIFLVRFLGGIHRYVTRLEHFLDARADVLQLCGSTPDAGVLAELLVPEKSVEMDPLPSFPSLTQLRDLLKTFFRKS